MKDSEKSTAELIEELTRLRQRVQTLEDQNKLFQAILDQAPIMISVKDLAGNITLANRRFNVLEHLAYEEFAGHNIYDLFPHDVADALWKDDLKVLASNQTLETEEAMTHSDKTKHMYYTVKFPISDEKDSVFGLCSLSYDISEVKQSLELSITDKLTGLYSRHYFNMCFQGQLYQSKQSQQLFTLMYVNIDQFDAFKAEYGEHRTNELVTTVAEALQSICNRTDDLCFRLKDHRFACILSSSDIKDIESTAEEVRTYVESLSIDHPSNTPEPIVTISLGYSVVNWLAKWDQQKICQMTKQALIKATFQGGNQICIIKQSEE